MQKAPLIIDHNYLPETDSVDTSMVEDLMASAHAEIAIIIAQANAKAENCLREASQEVEMIKQRAYEEGHQQGQEQGYQEGLVKGRQAGQDELQLVINQGIAKTQQMLLATDKDAKQMMKDAERQIIDIALAVARKILAYEIAENPMVVLPLVKAALEKVSDQEEIVIRVSSEDFEAVLLAKKELQNMVGREHALKITPDRTIESGSCVIDTSYGTVDARVDTQFSTIKKVLEDLAQ